jgi:hypothetical protein
MSNLKDITWLITPPKLGSTYIFPIEKGKKQIGYIHFNAWAMEPEAKVVARLWRIEITNKAYRMKGIAFAVLRDWLQGFDRVDTGFDSEAGLNLILKAGFRTSDGVTYIWERE